MEFQSLLFWNSVCELGLFITYMIREQFQSLLFWNSVCETFGGIFGSSATVVSILVVLEFGL